jgi:hypothetical protein
VLHLLWAWQPRLGRRGVAFYILQAWLSRTWAEIHGAPMVWVTRYRGGRTRLSRYMVSQYVGNQSAFVRYAWSWRTFGFALVKAWARVRALFPLPRVCRECRNLLRRQGSAGLDSVRSHHPPVDRRALLTMWSDVLLGRVKLSLEGGLHE